MGGTLFCAALVMVALAELLLPRRAGSQKILTRWASNFGIVLINSTLVRLVAPVGATATALYAGDQGWGLFNHVAAPNWLLIVCAVLLLDLMEYWLHRLLHAVPLLWRAHRVHHADLELDFTTSYRHHPLEVVFTTVCLSLTVLALGAPPEAVMIYPFIAMVMALYTHANIRFSATADRLLRRVFVTPDVHAVHHSAAIRETDSNYGGVFIWWDRLFNSYVAAPAAGLDHYTVGLDHFRSPRDLLLDRMLIMPFLSPVDATAAVNTRASVSFTTPPAERPR